MYKSETHLIAVQRRDVLLRRTLKTTMALFIARRAGPTSDPAL